MRPTADPEPAPIAGAAQPPETADAESTGGMAPLVGPSADPASAARGEEGTGPRWPSAAPPRATDTFIGRDDELTRLEARLVDGARLLNLVGIGGVGKSRLAAELAGRRLAGLGGRVAYVSLDAVTDSSLLLPTVARSLGAEAPPGRGSAERVADALGPGPALLVLDRLEHLRSGVGILARLLDLAPELAIVATSRVPLGLPGETVARVEPLAVPQPGSDDRPDRLLAAPAVALFCDRIRSSRPDLDARAVAPIIAAICRRLDGIPLAIELAAASLRVIAPHQLLDQLAIRPATPDPAGSAAWQRVLRATMDSSIDLLDDPVRRLYRRLAVFAQAFDAAHVEALLEAAIRRGLAPVDVPTPEALGALARASLLRRVAGRSRADAVRWVMLTTVRADALARLDRSGEAATVRWAHAYLVLAEIERAEADLATARETAALDAIDALHDDAREALDWAIAAGDGTFALRLTAALAEFWRTRGHLTEGRLRLGAALAMAPGAPASVRRKALSGAGLLASHQGDYALAGSLLDEALSIARGEDDPEALAAVLNVSGTNAYGAGDLPRAEVLVTEALALRRVVGEEGRVAVSLNALGGIHHFRGNLDAARSVFEESLEIKRRIGSEGAFAVALTNLGLVERDAGAVERAEELLVQAVEIWDRIGDRQRWAVGLHNSALLALDRGDLAGAARRLDQAIATARQLGDRAEIAYALADRIRVDVAAGELDRARSAIEESLRSALAIGSRVIGPLALEGAGNLAASVGDTGRAVRLWAAAAADRAASGFNIMPADRRLLEAEWTAVRARIGEEAWRDAWAAGWATPFAAAAAEVLAGPGSPAS